MSKIHHPKIRQRLECRKCKTRTEIAFAQDIEMRRSPKFKPDECPICKSKNLKFLRAEADAGAASQIAPTAKLHPDTRKNLGLEEGPK